jgi:TPR repeat protein
MYDRALPYLNVAASYEHCDSLWVLAQLYTYGWGVDIDYKLASSYIERAYALGCKDALRLVKEMGEPIRCTKHHYRLGKALEDTRAKEVLLVSCWKCTYCGYSKRREGI